MNSRRVRILTAITLTSVAWIVTSTRWPPRLVAQATPAVFDPSLGVRTVVSGLIQPTSMAFLGANDFLVLEKASGQVKHVVGANAPAIALDLAVNNNSERGLLGIALHPAFATNHFVYLYQR